MGDRILLGEILLFGRVIRNPIVIEFARLQQVLKLSVPTGPEDVRAFGGVDSKDFWRVVEQLCGPIEFKTAAEVERELLAQRPELRRPQEPHGV
jgi:hypothetical protein